MKFIRYENNIISLNYLKKICCIDDLLSFYFDETLFPGSAVLKFGDDEFITRNIFKEFLIFLKNPKEIIFDIDILIEKYQGFKKI